MTEMKLNSWVVWLDIKMDKKAPEPKEINLHMESDFELKDLWDLEKLKLEAKEMWYGSFWETKVHHSKIYITGNKTKKIRLDKD